MTSPTFAQSYHPPAFNEPTVTVTVEEGIDSSIGRGLLLHQFAASGNDPHYTCSIAPAEPTTDADGVDFSANLAVSDFDSVGSYCGNGLIYLRRAAFDFEDPADRAQGEDPEYVITITATDFVGRATQTVNVQVTDTNDTPIRTGQIENQEVVAGGSELTIALEDKFHDPDHLDRLFFTAQSDATQFATTIYSGGKLRIRGRRAGLAWITVTARDRTHAKADQPLIFSVTVHPNTPPVISESQPGWEPRNRRYQFSLDENVGVTKTVTEVPISVDGIEPAVLMATDINQADQELSWSLAGGDGGSFAVVADKRSPDKFRLVYRGDGLDYESKGRYIFHAVVHDASGATDRVEVIVWVNDVAEAPRIRTAPQDVSWPLSSTERVIDLTRYFVDQDSDLVYYTAKAIPTGVVEVTHQGVINSTEASSRISVKIVAQGETNMSYCATDQKSILNDLDQSAADSFNVQLYDACRSLPTRHRATANFKITVTPPTANQIRALSSSNSTSPTTFASLLQTSPAGLSPVLMTVETDWFEDDNHSVHATNINRVAELGISSGCNPPSNTRFCPDRNLTRAEMATFLVRAFSIPATGQDFFIDDNQSLHEDDINSLAAAGITAGCNPSTGGNLYCPDLPINRAEMASFMVRVLDLTEEGIGFSDIDSIHAPQIRRIQAAGIAHGCNPPANNLYCPDRPLTRAEFASFLIRSLQVRDRSQPSSSNLSGSPWFHIRARSNYPETQLWLGFRVEPDR